MLKYSAFINVRVVSVEKFRVPSCSIDSKWTIHRDVLYAEGLLQIQLCAGKVLCVAKFGRWLADSICASCYRFARRRKWILSHSAANCKTAYTRGAQALSVVSVVCVSKRRPNQGHPKAIRSCFVRFTNIHGGHADYCCSFFWGGVGEGGGVRLDPTFQVFLKLTIVDFGFIASLLFLKTSAIACTPWCAGECHCMCWWRITVSRAATGVGNVMFWYLYRVCDNSNCSC